MFRNCEKLTNVNFSSSFYTNKVTDMSRMFCGCYNLKNINYLNLNTENVTNMSEMFKNCD